MKSLQKSLIIVLMSILGMLFSVSNSWAPIEIKTNKNSSSLKSINDFWICLYINKKYSGFENYKIEAKRRNLNCKSTNSIGNGSLDNLDINEKKITDKELCRYATDPTKTRWALFERDIRFVDEAQRRGLDCGIKDSNLTVITSKAKNDKISLDSNQSANLPYRPLRLMNDSTVCYHATKFSYLSKVWKSPNNSYVVEANYRGLSCGVEVNNSSITASNQIINAPKRPLASVSDSTVCNNATITLNGKKVWNDRNVNFVGEANYRGLDCGVKENNNNLIANIKKIKPSVSSSELEAEKQKRLALQRKAEEKEQKLLEEARKRKALEQRIAELEKKNKELSKAKKKETTKPKGGSGSGFFISKLGHIITNHHVVNQCSKITVGDSIDKQVPAQLLETDKRNDLALLRTTTLKMASAETKTLIQKLSIHIVPLATGGLMRGNDIELGEDVLVAGFPYGDIFSKNIKVTKGIVSSTTGVGDDSGQFQLDAAVQPGNSGGPIYDKYGNIVGVVVAQLNKFKMAKTIGSLPENVNFGIKASTVKQFLNTSGLPTKWSERNEPMSNQELSKIASKQTVMVVCHRD